MNHFEFYQLPVSLTVDDAAVRRIYLLNSKKFHPDFHTLSDPSEQEKMLELSTRNNEAFKALSDPDKRIRHVLELNGLLGDESENPSLPQDFLMEMMEVNEALMELEFDFDETRYNQTASAVKEMEENLERQIQPICASWTEATGTKEELLEVRDYFFKRRYLLRIKENLSKFAPA